MSHVCPVGHSWDYYVFPSLFRLLPFSPFGLPVPVLVTRREHFGDSARDRVVIEASIFGLPKATQQDASILGEQGRLHTDANCDEFVVIWKRTAWGLLPCSYPNHEKPRPQFPGRQHPRVRLFDLLGIELKSPALRSDVSRIRHGPNGDFSHYRNSVMQPQRHRTAKAWSTRAPQRGGSAPDP